MATLSRRDITVTLQEAQTKLQQFLKDKPSIDPRAVLAELLAPPVSLQRMNELASAFTHQPLAEGHVGSRN